MGSFEVLMALMVKAEPSKGKHRSAVDPHHEVVGLPAIAPARAEPGKSGLRRVVMRAARSSLSGGVRGPERGCKHSRRSYELKLGWRRAMREE